MYFLFGRFFGHKRCKNCLRPSSLEKSAAGCLHTLSSHRQVLSILSHHLHHTLTFIVLGTAGTTPALPHHLFAATTPFLDNPSKIEVLAVAMSHPTVATDGVWIVLTLPRAGTPTKRSTGAAAGTDLPLVTVLGRMGLTLLVRAATLWRRSFLATSTTPPNNTPVLISRSTTIFPSRLPVLEFQSPLLPSPTPRLTPFFWKILPTLATTPLRPSKSIRFLS